MDNPYETVTIDIDQAGCEAEIQAPEAEAEIDGPEISIEVE